MTINITDTNSVFIVPTTTQWKQTLRLFKKDYDPKKIHRDRLTKGAYSGSQTSEQDKVDMQNWRYKLEKESNGTHSRTTTT